VKALRNLEHMRKICECEEHILLSSLQRSDMPGRKKGDMAKNVRRERRDKKTQRRRIASGFWARCRDGVATETLRKRARPKDREEKVLLRRLFLTRPPRSEKANSVQKDGRGNSRN